MAKEMILKIKELKINRSYGFNDGGYIVVGHYYKNHKPVQGVDDIIFSDRSAIVETYAIACGIKREDDLHKLVGKQVGIQWEDENGYDVEYLTRPFSISKKLGKEKWDLIVGVAREESDPEMEEAV